MSLIKTTTEIQCMREGGILLSQALRAAVDLVRPGVHLIELDKAAEQVIRKSGGRPSFKGYRISPEDTAFPTTLCASVNEEIVHGPANRGIILKEGDIIGLDIGCWYRNLCTDMAVTVPVGVVDSKLIHLMHITRESLLAGVKAAQIGNEILDVSTAIEEVIRPHGYGIIRALVGHGVGHAVHEEPSVPNYIDHRASRVLLKKGMCIAIEPMVSLGGWQVADGNDGWTVVIADGSPGAHFEVTVAITEQGPEILTPLPV